MNKGSTRAAVTATAIENAAIDLALERGYQRVTVDMICDAAGVSQRTFFNHFPTKEDAILGREMPTVDERAARRFILADGPLLLDALALIPLPQDEAQARLADRMSVISTSPTLLTRQMERVTVIEDELREIIALRVGRRRPHASAVEQQQEAALVTHLLAGVMRLLATPGDSGSRLTMSARLEGARTTLAGLLSASSAAPEEPV